MTRSIISSTLSSAAVIATAFLPLVAEAGVYQAVCSSGSECTVTIAAGKLSMPGASIEKDQILSWSQGGSGSKTDVGMGIGSVVLFGLPGLIGFGAKKHDYVYYINHVDASGEMQMATVGFKNNSPANQFMMEMMGMTGLTIGEVNKPLQERLGTIKQEVAEKARIASLDCSTVLKPYKCSYSAYLESNPGPKAWAEKYPQMVTAEKARLKAID